MHEIESVTVLPEGVTSIRIAGVDLPVVLRAGETIQHITFSVHRQGIAIDRPDGQRFFLMEWMEVPATTSGVTGLDNDKIAG